MRNGAAVHGSDLSATVEGYLYLGNQPGLHFTIDAHVKLMGNHIEGTPTMVFDDGSKLNLYYEIKQNRDTGIFEGTFQITSGTGQFEGASGSGEICYPVAQSGPLMMEGTITSLVVVDEGQRPRGVVHLHDILRAKIV